MFVTARKMSFLLLSMTTMAVSSVLAADIPLFGPIPFENFDKDDNKIISPQEFVDTHNLRKKMRTDAGMSPGFSGRDFVFFDTDGDSQITPDELDGNRGPKRQWAGKQPDFPKGPCAGMKEMQQRNMGQGRRQGMRPQGRPGMGPQGTRPGMGPQGMRQGQGMQQGQGMRQGGPRGMRPGMQQGMGRMAGQKMVMPKFSDFDLDGDGVMQRDEFFKAREQRMRKRAEQGYMMRNAEHAPPFGAVDADHDDKVTKEEFAAHQEKHRKMMGMTQPAQ